MDSLEKIGNLLASGQGLVLAVIVARSGSAPASIGTRMALLRDGTTIGTIGGGLLEAGTLNLAKKICLERKWALRDFHLNSEDASKAGMICGGNVRVLVHFVDAANPHDLGLYRAIASAVRENKKAWLITRIPGENETGPSLVQCFYSEDGFSLGGLDKSTLERIAAKGRMNRAAQVVWGPERYLVEPLGIKSTLFVFGAGHISRVLVPLCDMVGFKTTVLDDRREFADPEFFPAADRVVVVGHFNSAFNGLEVDENSSVVLVTRGHMHDMDLLAQALGTKAGYIGMIGSRNKREAIYRTLTSRGFTNRDFERVHSPIGLDICAETPEEIAVSIVAELIQKRARRTACAGLKA